MWVKVCGVRDVETARHLAALPVDAIGLNFFEDSPRWVDRGTAARIAQQMPPHLEVVGLFVNHPADEVLHTVEDCGIGTVQIHGDEAPAHLAELQERRPDLRLLRAFRIGGDGLFPMAEYLQECRQRGVTLAGCLVDSRVSGAWGGTGHTAPWDLIADDYDAGAWPPLIVAGGLTPLNVAEAIRTTAPWGVDVASGVETAPGIKDFDRIRQFLDAVRGAGPAPVDGLQGG